MAEIKNIVFDVGNVLVRWDPIWVIDNTFAQDDNKDKLLYQLFRSGIWTDLNLGKFSESEAHAHYHKKFGIPHEKLQRFSKMVRRSLTPLPGSFELFDDLHRAGHSIYLLTDNVHELVAHLKETYAFWQKTSGAVVSAEVGYLKPSQEIYQHLLDHYRLQAEETLFFDDLLKNIEGAKRLGIHGIQFEHAEQASLALKQLGVTF